jgi:hypothetical protein
LLPKDEYVASAKKVQSGRLETHPRAAQFLAQSTSLRDLRPEGEEEEEEEEEEARSVTVRPEVSC